MIYATLTCLISGLDSLMITSISWLLSHHPSLSCCFPLIKHISWHKNLCNVDKFVCIHAIVKLSASVIPGCVPAKGHCQELRILGTKHWVSMVTDKPSYSPEPTSCRQ